MGKAAPFAWLSVAAFRRLTPFEKEAYLRELAAHLTDRLVEERRSKAKPRKRVRRPAASA